MASGRESPESDAESATYNAVRPNRPLVPPPTGGKMKCPIRKIHDHYGKEIGDRTCDKECAWFIRDGCLFLKIEKSLDILAKQGAR